MCRWPLSCEMYEGKNIHYSPVDNKPLCSFSQKQCNQRRLNGYGFCVRHILEDPTAPFRRCAYVAKSSQHLCTQAIPYGESRQYCNNHMQVLGMLPRRERKPKKEKDKDKDKDKEKDKDNVTTTSDSNKMTFGDRLKSKKLSMPKTANSPLLGKVLNPVDDPDDPYAFHDAIPEGSPVSSSQMGGMSGGLADMASRSPYPQSLPSPSQPRTPGDMMGGGGLSKAKLYPELAEKLEKVRMTPETKPTKSRARISRTMNKLQTKIAQNKIKDKLRKSQESSQAEFSPSQVASPERMALNAATAALLHSGIVGSGFGAVAGSDANSIGLSPSHLHPLTLPGLGLPGIDGGRGVGVTGLPGAGSRLLGMERLAAESLPSQLLSSLHPLPPPYPGPPLQREQHFSPTHGQVVGPGQCPIDKPPVTTTLPSHTPVSPFLSFSQASSLSAPVVSPAQSQPQHVRQQRPLPHPRQQPSQQLPSHQPQASQAAAFTGLPKELWSSPHHPSVLNQSLPGRQSFADSAGNLFPQTSAILTSKNVKASPLVSPSKVDLKPSSLDLRPPPPYAPRSLVSSLPTSVNSSVLNIRVHRPKGVLTEKEARARLRNDDAVKVYGMYVHQRINNHVFMEPCMSLCASDEEGTSEEEMDDELLPFQRDWKVLSDDEEDNEFEEDGELPSDLRMVKLGVMRARYRRHCTQTKHATRINTKTMMSHKKFTLALLRLAKERPSTAAHTLAAICTKPLQWPQERKRLRKVVWRKVCQYKDGADQQCTVMCLPYTNHCRKHVMYNVDQQLFQFCTAKNSDNTQCCMPVIDIRHDFSLCFPHALQAEHQLKEEAAEAKKRPRKKTKPPALTRPPRKGKKKKGKNARPQKPMPPDKPTGDISMPDTEPMELTPAAPQSQPDGSTPSAPPTAQPHRPVPPLPPVAASISVGVAKEKSTHPSTSGGARGPKENKHLEHALGAFDLDETLSPDFDKPFELPLEQASRLLEDQDFENFPDDAFNDIFSMADKNGEPDALAKENEKLERQLALVTDNVLKTKDTLEKLLAGEISMEDLPEHETKQLAEAISLLPSISGEGVQSDHIPPTSTAPALDPYSSIPRHQPLPTMALQQPQTPLTDFGPLVTAAGQPPVSLASFLQAGVSTTVNGMTVGGVGQHNSVVYNPGSLSAGFVTTSALHHHPGTLSSGGQVFHEGCLPQGYHMVQAAGQGQGQLAAFQGLQGLPSGALLLSGAGGELTLAQQQAFLASRLASQQQARAAATAASSPQVVRSQIEVVGGGGIQAPNAAPPRPSTTVSSLPPRTAVLATSRTQAGPSVVTVQPHQGPSSSGLASQLQAQPVLAAQLAGGVHPTWAAALQQAGNAGSYHVNGFPATQLSFTNAVSIAHTTAAKTSAQQAKFNALHVNNVSLAGSGNATVSLSNLVKREHMAGATALLANQSPSSPATGLKQDPRMAVLTQQHSRTGGSVGSPGYVPVHSPSPTHSPQGLNQALPPFPAALPAYQSTGTGS